MMKIFSLLFVVVAIPTAAFAAGSSIEDNLPSVLSSSDWLPSKLVAAKHHQRHLNRDLQGAISTGCETAIAELEDDTALNAADKKKEEEFDAIPVDDVCNVSGNDITCKYDLTTLPSHDEYVDACKAADGRLVDFDFTLDCKDSDANFVISVSDDTCLPNACTQDEYESIIEEVEQVLGDLFAGGMEGTGATCTVSSAFGLFLSSVVVTTTSLLVITTLLTMM